MGEPQSVPARAWVVTVAGTVVNLCLGILYAWSVWKAALLAPVGVDPGSAMPDPNDGWAYLDAADATTPYAICGFVFALAMIPGGRLQDRYGPRVGATLAGLFLGAGCLLHFPAG
jgi:OFA family oxalate/formate antiporter-like MFS transporter